MDVEHRVPEAVRALNAGVDDYLTPELPQRLYEPLIRARLRRSPTGASEVVSVIEDGRISLDLGTHLGAGVRPYPARPQRLGQDPARRGAADRGSGGAGELRPACTTKPPYPS